MGKISDALKKVNQQRQMHKQLQERRPAEELKKRGQEAREPSILPEKDDIIEQAAPSGGQAAGQKKVSPKDASGEGRGLSSIIPSFIAEARDSSGIDPRVVTYHDYSSPISEQYRILRTNIKSLMSKKFSSDKFDNVKSAREAKIFSVTSALRGEGKTVTSINLAIALAKDLESKVLLIDCDLRSGAVHKFLNVDSGPGLSEVLSGGLDYGSAIRRTRLENLFVMPRGEAPSNPSELLGSKKMRNLIERLKAELISYIIIDTPPMLPFTDAGVLGAQTDGTIVVVQANRTKAEIVEKAKGLLTQARIKLLGFILTQADYYIPDMYGYYHYYRHGNNGDK